MFGIFCKNHPDLGRILTHYGLSYGIILTQIPPEDIDVNVSDQRHTPVAFFLINFFFST
jgi:hypothetical protein